MIFCGNPTWEPESIVCNDEQGDLFCGPTQEPVLATAETQPAAGREWRRGTGRWGGGGRNVGSGRWAGKGMVIGGSGGRGGSEGGK